MKFAQLKRELRNKINFYKQTSTNSLLNNFYLDCIGHHEKLIGSLRLAQAFFILGEIDRQSQIVNDQLEPIKKPYYVVVESFCVAEERNRLYNKLFLLNNRKIKLEKEIYCIIDNKIFNIKSMNKNEFSTNELN